MCVCVHYVFGSETNMMCSVERLSTKNEEGIGEHNYLRWKNEEGGKRRQGRYFTSATCPTSWLKKIIIIRDTALNKIMVNSL